MDKLEHKYVRQMNESGDYLPGAEHDSSAPWNQEENVKTVEEHLIPVYLDEDQIDVNFQLEIEDNGDDLIVNILEGQYCLFPESWNEDVRLYLEEKFDKIITLVV